MLTIFHDGKMMKGVAEPDKGEHSGETLWIGNAEFKEQTLCEFGFRGGSKIKHENTCFESHKGFDYLYFLVPSEDLTEPESERIEIYLADQTMLLFYDGKSPIVETWIKMFLSTDEKADSLNETFLTLLSLLITRYLVYSDKIEDKITELEDALTKEENRDYVGEISILRKELLTLRRYYECVLALLEDLEENRNGLLDEDDLRLLHFQTQKAERLY